MTNPPMPHTIGKEPATIRVNCSACGGPPRLHRCVLVRMYGPKNIVTTTCLTCGKEVTG